MRCKHNRLAEHCTHCREDSSAPPSGSRISVGHPKYVEGYLAGMEDPGYATATQPKTITNPYAEATEESENYEAGYRQAIR